MTAFLCFGLTGFSFMIENDTIIIDGKKLLIEMAYEAPEDSLFTDSKEVKEESPNDIVLEASLCFGPSFNKNSSKIDLLTLDQFIGKNHTGGSFFNGAVLTKATLSKRGDLKFGLGLSFWSQNMTLFSSVIDDDFYRFDSPEKGDLDQVLGIPNDLGVDIIDTVGVNLERSQFNQLYLEVPILYQHRLSESTSKNTIALSIGVSPGYFISGKRGRVDHLSDTRLESYSASDFKWNSFGLSGELGMNFEFPLGSHSDFILKAGYRRNLSAIYSAQNTYDSSRNSIFVGFGIKLNFERDNKEDITSSI